jgi:hypothetical protein
VGGTDKSSADNAYFDFLHWFGWLLLFRSDSQRKKRDSQRKTP